MIEQIIVLKIQFSQELIELMRGNLVLIRCLKTYLWR